MMEVAVPTMLKGAEKAAGCYQLLQAQQAGLLDLQAGLLGSPLNLLTGRVTLT